MSPIAIHQVYRHIPTSLDLNGPVLSFTTQPEGLFRSASGTATFVGIATVSFPGNSSPDNSGSISYRWYDQNGALSDSTSITGTATTTLTISNIQSPGDNGRSFYLKADYVPSTDTGNAINEPLDSNVGILTVYPTITFATQPQSETVGEGGQAVFTADATLSDTSFGGLSFQWSKNGTALSDRTSPLISGSRTETLTIEREGTGTDTVNLTASIVVNNTTISATSNTVDYIGVAARNILNFEGFDSVNNDYTSAEVNLDTTDTYTLNSSTFGSDYSIITFHSPETSFDVRMQIYAAKGANSGSNSGGNGGFTEVDLTLREDTEYTVVGVSNNSGVFIYEGSTLILVVGQGGDAGRDGNGGAGGGANGDGANGTATIQGSGGRVPSNLTLAGVWGSIISASSVNLYPGDSIASGSAGGRTITCSRGRHWIDQGVSACSNNSSGNIKFRYNDGTEETESSSIIRGFKPGYTVTTTRGVGVNNGGNGGNGATGGEGGRNGGGGGGGSGYTNGTATIRRSTQGGNSSTSSYIVFSLKPATETVTWSISREAGDSNRVTYSLSSGEGPSSISFGPNGGSFTTEIAPGSVYRLQSVSGSGPGSIGLRISGNTLQLDDRRGAGADSDWNDLQVTPNKGRWNGTGEYRLD